MNYRILIVFLLLSVFVGELFAITPPISIKGVVLDKNNEPIIGATILVKNGQQGTVTNVDGEFSLEKIPSEQTTLVISMISFISQEIKVTGNIDNLKVILHDDDKLLEEVVVVGYQAIRKSELSGAVASIKSSELNLTTPSVGQALVGKVAGVQIAQVSGAPYKGTKIRIRGVASINASSDPLYVIDGYPSNADLNLNPEDIESIEVLKDAASAAIYGSRAAGGVVLINTKRGKVGKPRIDFNYQVGVNQLAKKIKMLNSMEFAELLVEARNNTYKDIVTNAGKPWDDSMYSDSNDQRAARIGSSNSGVRIPEFLYDFANQKVITPQYDTDWQDELYQNALNSRYNLSVSGGTKGIRYQIGAGYHDQEGIIVSTEQKRLNLRENLDIEISPKMQIGLNMSTTSNWNKEVEEGRFHQGPIMGALVYAPIFKARNEDGSLAKFEMADLSSGFGFQSIENPVALATETKIKRNQFRNTYNIFGIYKILSFLDLKANLGMYTSNEKYEYYKPTSLSAGNKPPYSPEALAAANSRAITTNIADYLGEFTALFKQDFGQHHINGVLGYSLQRNLKDIIDITAKGFQDDYIQEITGHGADPNNFMLTQNKDNGKFNWSMLSYFSRINYNFKNKYYLTGSFRGDGSSLFSPDNRWGYFPSISIAWALSNEDFYKNTFGENSTLKIRASWGKSGNNSIGYYRFRQEMEKASGLIIGNGTIATAIRPGAIRDKNLGWESTSQYNIGTDLSLFNNRLFFSANYYQSDTYNLLFEQSISAISGSTSILTNLPDSKIRNSGIDLQIDGRIIDTKDFGLNASGNISFNKNKILDLGGAGTILTNGAERSYKTHITMEGQPIGMFYGFKVAGMVKESDMTNLAEDDKYYDAANKKFPDGYKIKGPARSIASSTKLVPGDIYFEDKNGDGVVKDEDKDIIGSPHPDFIFGFNLTARYKSFDLSASFNGAVGNKVLDGRDYYLFNMEGSGNQYAKVNERYRNALNSGNGEVYRAARGGTQSNSTRLSTFYLQDGSFLRCTNLTLGYNFSSIQKITKNNISKLRLYIATDNLFTITKYIGYNPEVDYNDGSNLTPGVDYGKYPLVKAFNFGIQLGF